MVGLPDNLDPRLEYPRRRLLVVAIRDPDLVLVDNDPSPSAFIAVLDQPIPSGEHGRQEPLAGKLYVGSQRVRESRKHAGIDSQVSHPLP
jgi:hypothetical protein